MYEIIETHSVYMRHSGGFGSACRWPVRERDAKCRRQVRSRPHSAPCIGGGVRDEARLRAYRGRARSRAVAYHRIDDEDGDFGHRARTAWQGFHIRHPCICRGTNRQSRHAERQPACQRRRRPYFRLEVFSLTAGFCRHCCGSAQAMRNRQNQRAHRSRRNGHPLPAGVAAMDG